MIQTCHFTELQISSGNGMNTRREATLPVPLAISQRSNAERAELEVENEM